jgi:hypothetical protein
MALSDVIAVLRADTSQFTAKLDAAEAQMGKLSKSGASNFQKLGAAGKMAFEAIGAAAVGIGIYSVIQANKLEDAQAALGRAFKNTGTTTEKYQGQIDTLNKKFESYGYTNAQTEDALQRLVSATGNVSGSFKAMGTAADIAKARHIDLDTATGLMAKTMAGNVTAAKRMGILIPPEILKLKDPVEKANAVMAILNDRFGGQAATAAETFGGKTEALKVKLQDVAAKIGEKLIPIILKLATVFGNLIDWFEKHKIVFYVLASIVGVLLVGSFFAWTASIVATNIALYANPVVWVIAGFALLVASLVIVILKWKEIAKFLRSDWGTACLIAISAVFPMIGLALLIATYWNEVRNTLIRVWHEIYDNFVNPLVSAFIWLKDIAYMVVAEMTIFWQMFGGTIGGIFSGIANAISSPFIYAFNLIKHAWNSTVGGFGFSIPGWLGGGSFKIPNMALGGIVPATPGGQIMRLGEAGYPEAVIPLDGKHSMGNSTINVYVQSQSDPNAIAAEVAWAMKTMVA